MHDIIAARGAAALLLEKIYGATKEYAESYAFAASILADITKDEETRAIATAAYNAVDTKSSSGGNIPKNKRKRKQQSKKSRKSRKLRKSCKLRKSRKLRK